MFEFSLASLVLIGIACALVWHFYATKILGYKSAADSALHTDIAKFKAELTGAHATLEAKVVGAHDILKAEIAGQHAVNVQRIDTLEQTVMPAASAGVTAAAVPATKP